MKTILVPIDHTAAAEHTLAYANKLAVRWPAEVVLLYCHPTPVVAPALAAELANEEQRLRSLVERLRYQQLTRQDGRRIQYRYRILSGCLHDHVRQEAQQCAANLVVMGLEHIDCGKQAAPGNHAAAIAELVSCPVLVVPPGRRALPSRLVFAADFTSLGASVLPRLSALQEAFPAHLDLVHFYAPTQRPHRRQLKQAVVKAAAQLPWLVVAPNLLEDDAPLEGTNEFCARHQAQLLIIAPGSQAQLLRYFDSCYTTTRAYHTQIPVLVLRAVERQPTVACCDRCAERLAQTKPPVALPDYHAIRWA
ncbi:universal stress protein [Hymenobacter chitinivorans]|uniref:Nucleotide-binding universal stress UspA family protein n=1 Tax=Hymenobacter chitinivorans DSM 11115 TaxID=1121954 RepID=A0A2M9BP69_9BACT|nr:universal stress protein [Hymenobacter chitinivorans]PJJ59745.1 nucleotide-binding universal stress UspA family protein [Hymenobacter chitinivorans DSM 11115]